MTFDFTPDWMETLLRASPFTPAEPAGSAGPKGMPAPTYPSQAEVAMLVSELFAEGTLSADQLHSLSRLPELSGHLGRALASLPLPRRSAAGLP